MYLTSSIIKKQIMGITGLLLCGFALTHIAANLLIIFSPDAFNQYTYALAANKAFLYTAEAGLLLIFLVHMFLAMKLTLENKSARPEGYAMRKHSGRGASFASSTMPYTGGILLIYLVFHIWHLKFGAHYTTVIDGVEMRDLYKLVIEYFSNPLTVVSYVLAMGCFAVHVSHGFWSAFQSIGFNHPRYTPLLKKMAIAYGVAVGGGFAIIPVYVLMTGGQG